MLCGVAEVGLATVGSRRALDGGSDVGAAASAERAGVPARLDHQGRGTAGARCAGGDGVPTPSPCTGRRPVAPCVTSAWTTGMSPGSWFPPTRCLTIWPGCRIGRRPSSASTRADSPRSSCPDIHLGAPSAGTVTPPMFGPRVVGISLASACRMRFQRGKGDARQVAEVTLEPRSAYVLAGVARFAWQHSIPSTRQPLQAPPQERCQHPRDPPGPLGGGGKMDPPASRPVPPAGAGRPARRT
jgi:2OG-Fe(II) oxygenase superfamily